MIISAAPSVWSLSLPAPAYIPCTQSHAADILLWTHTNTQRSHWHDFWGYNLHIFLLLHRIPSLIIPSALLPASWTGSDRIQSYHSLEGSVLHCIFFVILYIGENFLHLHRPVQTLLHWFHCHSLLIHFLIIPPLPQLLLPHGLFISCSFLLYHKYLNK